ncbi:Y-family DNA polymerase, partial [Pseudomonas aeruginosa]
AYGVRSTMAMHTALKMCHDLLMVRPRFDVYREVSKQIHAIFRDYTNLIEPLSLDEDYLDVSDSPHFAGRDTRIATDISSRLT